MKCFRCGETGHWARQCTGGKGDSLIPVDMAEEFDAGEFPSLDQARDMASDYNYWDTNLRSEKFGHSLTAIAMNRRDVRFSSTH